jgi:hypothetical protein
MHRLMQTWNHTYFLRWRILRMHLLLQMNHHIHLQMQMSRHMHFLLQKILCLYLLM